MATQLETLLKQRETLSKQAASSNTAFSRDPIPYKSDLTTANKLNSINSQIDSLKSQQLSNQWYGAKGMTAVDAPAKSDGVFMTALTALQKPLNTIVGGIQYGLGKGTEKSLISNMQKGIDTGIVAGDVLKQYDLPRWVTAPLGFALDVALDPINWATAGTAALIPRVGTGLVKGAMREGGIKGGLAAAKVGLTSNLAKKAAYTMDIMPFAKKLARAAPGMTTKIDDLAKVGAKVGAEGIELAGKEAASLAKPTIRSTLTTASQKYSDLADLLRDKAIKGSTKYDELIGTNVWDRVNSNIWGDLFGKTAGKPGVIGRGIEDLVNKIPETRFTPSGEKLVKSFKYSTSEAAKVADARDQVIKAYRAEGVIPWRGQTGAHFNSLAEFFDPKATIEMLDKKTGEIVKAAIWEGDQALGLKTEMFGKIKIKDNFANAKSMLQTAGEDLNLKYLTEAYKEIPKNRTGVAWYDKVLDKLETTTWKDIGSKKMGDGDVLAMRARQAEAAKNAMTNWNTVADWKGNLAEMKPFNALLTFHRFATTVFKAAKVPMNVGSHVVANLGNAVMGAMYGIPVNSAEFRRSFVMANRVSRGSLGVDGLKNLFKNDINNIKEMMINNPTRFRKIFGVSADEIEKMLSYGDEVSKVKFGPKTTFAQLDEAIEEGFRSIDQEKLMQAAAKRQIVEAQDKLKLPTPSQSLAKTRLETGGDLIQSDIGSSFIESEIQPTDWYDAFKEWVKDKRMTNPGNPGYSTLDGLVNTMPKWYEQIDQTWKIATVDYATRVGFTEEQLIKISRALADPIVPTDILDTVTSRLLPNGSTLKLPEKYYKLKPLRASEVALEAFMDYSAMPDAVRVMRTLPILGSPFISFPYAMVAKTGKTLVSNPAIFNKIAFLTNEISGARTPEEKAAMESKYNQYMNSPTMVKLFGMWNLDVKNMIPYLQMNMFNPSNRTYDNSLGGQLLKYSDKFPILQDPIGQVFKDYYLQPWILSMTGSKEIPQGQFGQPLYPSYDVDGKPITPSSAVKAFYAARTLGEAVVPGSLAYLGLLNLALGMSPEAVNLAPLYGFRDIANAAQGRSSIGKETKENIIQKTLRSTLGRTGIPVYTLDPTMTSTKGAKTQ